MEPLKRAVSKTLKVLSWSEEYFLIAAYVMIPVLILIEVFSRYLMKAAVIGIEEACLMIVAYVYYIGAAYAVKRDDHITVKVLHLLPIPPKLSLFIKYISASLGLICASAITWYMINYFLFIAKSPSLYTPFSFRKVYYLAGPTIGWILVFIYSVSNFVTISHRNKTMESE